MDPQMSSLGIDTEPPWSLHLSLRPMGSPQRGQGKDVDLGSTNGIPDELQIDALLPISDHLTGSGVTSPFYA